MSDAHPFALADVVVATEDRLDPLQAAATTLAPTADSLEASSTHLAMVLETSQSSLSSNQEATRALLDASKTIRSNAEKASTAWSKSASALQTTRDDFNQAHASLTEAARDFGATVEKVVKQLGDEQDTQLSSALGKLKDAVGSLNSMANTIGESIAPLADALDSSSQSRRR